MNRAHRSATELGGQSRRGAMHAGMMTLGLLTLLLGVTASCGLGRGWDIREPEPARPGETTGARPEREVPEAEPADDFTIWIARSGEHGQAIDTRGLPVRDDVVMCYESQFGLYPYIWQGHLQNGGVPVGLDMVAHIRELRKDIDRLIPNAMFDGLAVIDYEARDILWRHTAEEYREMVRDRLRQANPSLQGDELERASREAYDEASKRFMTVTLGMCRQMRPQAQWGMYYYPAKKFEMEEFEWLTGLFDVMLPGAYPVKFSVQGAAQNQDQAPVENYRGWVRKQIDLSNRYATDGQPVYVFVRTEYHGQFNATYGGDSINDLDAESMLLEPEEMGAQGVVFWCHTTSPEKAQRIEADLRRLEPLMRRALERRAER